MGMRQDLDTSASIVARRLTMIPTVIEMLAEYAHNAWTGWMRYIFSKGKINDKGELVIPKWAVDRWARQMNTPYEELANEEKKLDRAEADQILQIAYDDIARNALQHVADLVKVLENTPYLTVGPQ